MMQSDELLGWALTALPWLIVGFMLLLAPIAIWQHLAKMHELMRESVDSLKTMVSMFEVQISARQDSRETAMELETAVQAVVDQLAETNKRLERLSIEARRPAASGAIDLSGKNGHNLCPRCKGELPARLLKLDRFDCPYCGTLIVMAEVPA